MDEILAVKQQILKRLIENSNVDNKPVCALDRDRAIYFYKDTELHIYDGLFMVVNGKFSYVLTTGDSHDVVFQLVFHCQNNSCFNLDRPDIIICEGELS